MILLLSTAASYFYFNWMYFSLSKKLGQRVKRKAWLIFLSFFINYLFFYFCSMLEYQLMFNWFLFAFLLFLETLLYNGGDKRRALFTTLLGILYGLAANIICRSITAIVLNQTLQCFDNHTSEAGNLKGIPVFFGFLLAGLIFQISARKALLERIQTILNHYRQQAFLMEMMAGLFIYLFLNLLLYSTPLNSLFLKVWSIKSCLFCVIGFYIAARYTIRVCELDDYREKNKEIEQELKEQRLEEERLKEQASVDTMTGLYNRQYAEEVLASMIGQERSFTLCFLDLDGLKNVNDRYGHREGDRYILKAAEQIRRACRAGDILSRYGGDEFLILFSGITARAAESRAKMINKELEALKMEEPVCYDMSLSYGVAESREFPGWKDLIEEADRRMYIQKQNKKMARN